MQSILVNVLGALEKNMISAIAGGSILQIKVDGFKMVDSIKNGSIPEQEDPESQSQRQIPGTPSLDFV